MDTLNFHEMMIQNTENDSKILKFEALCTETCKLSLEAMSCQTVLLMWSRWPHIVAYLQMELDPESQKYCTINTVPIEGLYQFTRLPFGIASAPATCTFQKMMHTILQGISGTICYMDDILVTARVNFQL